ncbi:MAG TPA: hypothetical protein VKV06_07570 [Acidimicrobiales bacterium]|nr:hypothetical protein [Acidimicrobiales bacterium]
MLETPARVQVKLPDAVGTYDDCYLAATVFMHTTTWRDATRRAPTIRILHSA